MLRAWRSLATFEDRAGLRPWLYRIATNVCIDMLKGRSRARTADGRGARRDQRRPARGDRRPEATWIQPAPDSLILPPDGDPAERAVSRESVRLAFIAALQHLAPRQRAVLILRDVLRWRADGGRRAARDERRRGQQRAPPGPRRARDDRAPTRRRANPRRAIVSCWPPTSTPSSATTSMRSSACCATTPSSRCRRSSCGCKVATTSGAGCSPSTPARGAAHARRRQRVAGRCRLQAAGAGRPADRVRHPRARRRRRAHQRHPRLPRPALFELFGLPRNRLLKGGRSTGPASAALHHPAAHGHRCTTSPSPTNSSSSTRPPSAPWSWSRPPHRDAATCSRANASTAPRSAGTSHETSRSTAWPEATAHGRNPLGPTPRSRPRSWFSFDFAIFSPLGQPSPTGTTPPRIETRRPRPCHPPSQPHRARSTVMAR